jgi:hypothetical protein
MLREHDTVKYARNRGKKEPSPALIIFNMHLPVKTKPPSLYSNIPLAPKSQRDIQQKGDNAC